MQSREEPLQLKLDTHKSVFFKPTWVGCSSTSLFTFRNPSRLPLEFEWRVSQQHRKMLAVQPARGIIQPNESLVSALPRAGGKDAHHPHLHHHLLLMPLWGHAHPSIQATVISSSLMCRYDCYHHLHPYFTKKN